MVVIKAVPAIHGAKQTGTGTTYLVKGKNSVILRFIDKAAADVHINEMCKGIVHESLDMTYYLVIDY